MDINVDSLGLIGISEASFPIYMNNYQEKDRNCPGMISESGKKPSIRYLGHSTHRKTVLCMPVTVPGNERM